MTDDEDSDHPVILIVLAVHRFQKTVLEPKILKTRDINSTQTLMTAHPAMRTKKLSRPSAAATTRLVLNHSSIIIAVLR